MISDALLEARLLVEKSTGAGGVVFVKETLGDIPLRKLQGVLPILVAFYSIAQFFKESKRPVYLGGSEGKMAHLYPQ